MIKCIACVWGCHSKHLTLCSYRHTGGRSVREKGSDSQQEAGELVGVARLWLLESLPGTAPWSFMCSHLLKV